MRKNKNDFVENISIIAAEQAKKCTKLPMDNLVMPRFGELSPLFAMLFQQVVVTKEQPNGCNYDKDTYHVVLRVIDGKVLIDGKPDAYAWKHSKVEGAESRPIGWGARKSIENLTEFLLTIKDLDERDLVAGFLDTFRKDFLLVHTGSEERMCVEVTEDLYHNYGLKYCVDEWMETDENGMAEATELNIGDFLIITDAGAYCIRRTEFLLTHTM